MTNSPSSLISRIIDKLNQLCPPDTLALHGALDQRAIDTCLISADLQLNDALLALYRHCDGNVFDRSADGKIVFSQHKLPLFKGAFHCYPMQQAIDSRQFYGTTFVPAHGFAFAARLERDFLYLDLNDGSIWVTGLYSSSCQIADSFAAFLYEYALGLEDGSYVFDTEYLHYPRIVHRDDVGEEALYSTFSGATIGD